MSKITNKEIAEIIYMLKINYQYAYRNFTEEDVKNTILTWKEFLKDCNPFQVFRAIKNIIKNNPYPPTIADILQEYEKLNLSKLTRDKNLKLQQEKEKIEIEEKELLNYYQNLSEKDKQQVNILLEIELKSNIYMQKYDLKEVALLIAIDKFKNNN